MPQWDDIHEKAKALIDEGLQLLKDGAHEAGIIAESTAHAAKLHVIIQKGRVERYKLLCKLGQEAYAQLDKSAQSSIKRNASIDEIIEQVKALDREVDAASKEVSKLSIVKKKKSKAKKSKKK